MAFETTQSLVFVSPELGKLLAASKNYSAHLVVHAQDVSPTIA